MAKGDEARRANRVLLERGDLGALAPKTWKALVNVFDDTPKPRTVRVRVSRTAEESEGLANVRFPAGVWWTFGGSVPWVGESASRVNGALRFRFGSTGMSRTLIADLASGDYQVPSCEHLYVDACRYTPSTDAGSITTSGFHQLTEVSGEISDGIATDFSPLIVTAPSRWGAAGVDASAAIAVPPGAYAYELFPDSPLGTANVFELSPPGAKRDFVNSAYQPSGPLPVLSNTVVVQARGAAPVAARLVFWVR